jgi:tetratricopeptide (TPR) repeat protein
MHVFDGRMIVLNSVPMNPALLAKLPVMARPIGPWNAMTGQNANFPPSLSVMPPSSAGIPVAGLMSALPPVQDAQAAARTYAKLGERFYQANRFHASLRLNGLDYQVYNKRGVAKVSIRDYVGAFADYTQAIALKPNFYNAYINRGNLWVYLGDLARKVGDYQNSAQHYERALADYGQAIRINPVNSAGYENRSELYSNLGLRSQAIQDKGMVIRLQQMKPHMRLGLPYCPPRIALVLANDDYQGTENDLNGGPMHDAKSMAKVLQSQGFHVITGYNLTGPQTKAKVEEFIKTLNQNPGAISLTYYSGHGGSINGNNYLIPVDFTGTVDTNFEANSVSVDYLLKQLKYANSYFNMIFLDACRTPLPDGPAFRSARSVLKQWETEPGPGLSNTWIEYASRPKMPAIQSGSEGLYTKYLLKYMVRPDLNLKEVSMYTSYALENDPIAIEEKQHSRTQTDLSRTEPIAQAFSFARHCQSPAPHVRLPFTAQA